MISEHLLEYGFITSWVASDLHFRILYTCVGNKQHPKILIYAVSKLERAAHVQLFTCCNGIVTLGFSGVPIPLTSSLLGGLNHVRDALLIVFTLAGGSLPGHAVRQGAGGEPGSFPSGETAVLEPAWEERSAGHLGVSNAKT